MPFDPTVYELADVHRTALVDVAEAHEKLQRRQRSCVSARESWGQASWLLEGWHQLWLRRSLALLEGVQAEYNARRLVNAVVLLRALIETVAACYAVTERARALLSEGDLRGFYKRVLQAVYGTKALREGEPFPEAINVMTCLEKLEKVFPGTKRHYASLSETAHPNVEGITVFGRIDHGKGELQLTEARSAEFLVQRVIGGAHVATAIAAVVSATCIEEARTAVQSLERKYGPRPSQWPNPKATKEPSMQNWEYLIVRVYTLPGGAAVFDAPGRPRVLFSQNTMAQLTDALDALGGVGWELVAVIEAPKERPKRVPAEIPADQIEMVERDGVVKRFRKGTETVIEDPPRDGPLILEWTFKRPKSKT